MNTLNYTQQCLQAIKPYITGQATTCSYCDHLKPLILLEGHHTYITLAIGQIVEGYLQVCAQKHRTAVTGLYPHELDELVLMKRIVRDAYVEIYGTQGIAFEHGKAGSCLWGEEWMENMQNLCHHTHIHFLPVEVNIRDRIKHYLSEEIIIDNIQQLREFRRDQLKGDSYLYFEDVNEIGYVYPVDDQIIPRQFLRTCVAEELGVPDKADWITFPGEEYFQAGKEKIQPVVQRLYAGKNERY